ATATCSRARFRKPTESARTKPRSKSGSSKSGTATGRLRKTSPRRSNGTSVETNLRGTSHDQSQIESNAGRYRHRPHDPDVCVGRGDDGKRIQSSEGSRE